MEASEGTLYSYKRLKKGRELISIICSFHSSINDRSLKGPCGQENLKIP